MTPMRNEQRLPNRTSESRSFAERVQLVMTLTARLNALPFDDLESRRTVLAEVFGQPIPDSLSILPPFYCDYGLGASFGERVFINQGCFFLDLGGITIGDRVMIGPRVTLSTAGHPVSSRSAATSSPMPRSSSSTTSGSVLRPRSPQGEHRSRFGCRGRGGRGEGRAADDRCHGRECRPAETPEAGCPNHVTSSARRGHRG